MRQALLSGLPGSVRHFDQGNPSLPGAHWNGSWERPPHIRCWEQASVAGPALPESGTSEPRSEELARDGEPVVRFSSGVGRTGLPRQQVRFSVECEENVDAPYQECLVPPRTERLGGTSVPLAG